MKATREGKRFLVASFLIAIAAVNTGNNLIYLILSLMFALTLLSILILRINLSSLGMSVSSGSPVFAGDDTFLTVLISNGKKLIPSYSLVVSAPGALSQAYFPFLPTNGAVKGEIKIRFEKRGVWGYEDFRARSGFPFILFIAESAIKVSGEVLVYPALVSVEGIVRDAAGSEGEGLNAIVGSGDEMYSLREFRYGDDMRKIHWKASARASSLLVKEYVEEEFRKTTIILDNLKPVEYERFEKVVSVAASLSRYFLESGHLVRVLSCKKVIPFGGGEEQFFKILDILAVIREEDSWDSPAAAEREFPADRKGMYISVLKSPGSPMSNLAATSDLVVYADSL